MEVKRNYLYVAGLVFLVAMLLYAGSHRDKLIPRKSVSAPSTVINECERASERAAYVAAFVRHSSGSPENKALADAIVATIPTTAPDPEAADVDLVQNTRTGAFEYRLTIHARAAQAAGCEAL